MARTKSKSDRVLTIRLPEKDLAHLETYCIAFDKTKTEVLRELIRGLKIPTSATIASDRQGLAEIG